MRVALAVLLFAAAVVLPLFRQTGGARSWQTVWAEDGQVYSQQAMLDGGIAVVLRSHQGYLQLVPRVLGAFTPLVPVRSLSVYLAVSAAVVCALLAWFLYRESSDWISSRPVRLALASLVVLAPVLAIENTATITNTPWTIAAVTPWALVSLRDRRLDVAMRAAVAFLAPASAAVSAVFLPLALGAALIRRTRAAWVVAGAFAAGLVLQGVVFLNRSDEFLTPFPSSVVTLLELMSIRVFAVFLLGIRWSFPLWRAHRELLVVGAAVLTGALFAALLPRAGRRAQMLAAVFLAYAVITFVVPVWGRGTSHSTTFGGTAPTAYLRYSVVPTLMLSSAVAVLVAPSGLERSRIVARLGRWSFIAHTLVLTLVGFRSENPRRMAPEWSSSVETARQVECAGAPPGKLVAIPTAFFRAFFPVTLPCRHLEP